MNRKQIRERVEIALQDTENRHWSDREINTFIDDALVEFTRIAKYPQVEAKATNPGGSTALGEATKTGTLSVDGKTATITFSSAHNYAENDVLRAYCPTYFTVTVDASTNVITSDGWHGFSVNDPITFATSGTFPSGLSTATFYVKTTPSTTTFTVSTTEGGSVTSISDTGTGVHKVNISRTQPNEYLGPFNIKKVSDTVITYPVNFGNAVSSNPISVFRMGPTYTKPTTIAEIVSVSIDGRELAIYTESELNAAASSRNSRHFMLESSMGFHPNAFTAAVTTVDTTPRWRDQEGPIEAIVFNNRTADAFRIYPLPKENKDIYVDKDATTKVFNSLTVRGVPVVSGLSTDTSTPSINSYWHESLVFGALERAWLKESKVQNVEKSQMYRAKFLDQAMQAQRMEGLSSGGLSEGRNQGGFRINRSL